MQPDKKTNLIQMGKLNGNGSFDIASHGKSQRSSKLLDVSVVSRTSAHQPAFCTSSKKFRAMLCSRGFGNVIPHGDKNERLPPG